VIVVQTLPVGKAGADRHPATSMLGLLWRLEQRERLDHAPRILLDQWPALANPVSVSRLLMASGPDSSISANWTNNGIVWASRWPTQDICLAYNATNLTNQIYDSRQAAVIEMA